MAMNIGALIVGVGYLYRAVLDLGGDREQFDKHCANCFPESTPDEIRAWQKKRGWAELTVCAGAFILIFCERFGALFWLGAGLAACGLLALLKMRYCVQKK